MMSNKFSKSWDELPLVLSVDKMAEILGISRTSAYSLAHQEGFPCAKRVGSRIIISRDALIAWLEN